MGAAASGRRRSVAWVYYAIIAILGVVIAFSTGQMGMLLLALLGAAYSTYIFRGGRIVVWIW
ncbi:MAG TPA: hypothetical protein VIJ07_03470 [Dermatophilaceae bacterium]|jgi:hypothetical protein